MATDTQRNGTASGWTPQSLREVAAENENLLVASLLGRDDEFCHVAMLVGSGDLINDPAKRVFRAMAILNAQSKPIDFAGVYQQLVYAGDLDNVGHDYLARLDAIDVGSRGPMLYAERVLEQSQRRQLGELASRLAQYVDSPDGPLPDCLADAAARLERVKSRTSGSAELVPFKAGDLILKYPRMRNPVIEGLLREGETMNLIAPPKVGKSWLDLDLNLSVATGRTFLGHHVHQGNVLILDNELHAETIADRLKKVAEKRSIPFDEYRDRLFIQPLRGCLRDLPSMGRYFDAIQPGQFRVITLDAFYRFIPAGSKENSNEDFTQLYNLLDAHAGRIGCCFVLIHHASKGVQAGKSVTDVGAGAGAQSRASDAHVILRHHVEEGVCVLDAAVRSWPPVEPICLRWDFPVWNVEHDLDPTKLHGARPQAESEESRARKREEKEAEKKAEQERQRIADANTALAKLVEMKKATKTSWKTELITFNGPRMNAVIGLLLNEKKIQRCTFKRPRGGGKCPVNGFMPVKEPKKHSRTLGPEA